MTRLVIVAGEPGVGKSSVATIISSGLDASVFRTDEIRQELFEEPQYDEDESYITYGEMFYRGRQSLEAGNDVVLDATFSRSHGRAQAEHIANMTDSQFTIVRVHCNDWSELRRRLQHRGADEAGVDVYHQIRDRFDHIDRARVDIFNHGPKASTRKQIDDKVLP